MNLSLEKRDDILVAKVGDAHFGAETADEFKSRILAELPDTGGRIGVDLSNVDFMDSSGLGALVSILKTVRPSGDLVLYGMRSSVQEILRLTHLDAVFRCVEKEAKAIEALADPSAS